MLGKLFKHEMKATARLLLPIYIVLAAFTIMDRIVISLDIFHGVFVIIPGFITIGFVLSIAAIIIVSFVIIIHRFYKNLITDEGYLMFTLPVRTRELINSKLFAGVIWTIASSLAAIAAILIVVTARMDYHDFWSGFRIACQQFNNELGGLGTLMIIEFIVLIIISVFNGVLMIYVSIAIGQLFNGHKIIGSFAAYIGISFAIQIITTVLMVVGGLAFETYFTEIGSLPHLVIPFYIVFMVILTGLFYFGTDYIFKRKLNLE